MQFASKFSDDVFLKIGIFKNLYDRNFALTNPINETLSIFIEDMHERGFRPYDDALIRSRHKKGHNYSLVFLKQLLDFNEIKIIAKSNNKFKYNYSDKAVADEFLIERNILLYLKTKYMMSYQILCDCYSYRASKLSTKFIKTKELEAGNESQQMLFPFLAAIYSTGSSLLGFSSLAETLNEAGYKGYKTYNSISRAFSSNSAKVRYINEIVDAYNLDFDVVSAKNKTKPIEKKVTEPINELFKEFYGKDMEDIKGLHIKSLDLSDKEISSIVKEAISFRVEQEQIVTKEVS